MHASSGLNDLARDLRYAIRSLARARVLSFTVVLTVALGVAALTITFGVVNAALERGLIVNRTSNTVVRLLPAFIVTEREIDEAVGILDRVLQ